jgi:hypothetical protein
MTSGGEPPRLLLGNLDCEDDLAQQHAATPGARPPRRHPWTRRALARAAGAATLLRVFAAPGDRLWLLAPIAPDCLAELPGLPRPQVLSGPLPAQAPAARVLAWCETRTVAALRAGGELAAPVDPPACFSAVAKVLGMAGPPMPSDARVSAARVAGAPAGTLATPGPPLPPRLSATAAQPAGRERDALNTLAADPLVGLPLCEIVWRLPAAPPAVVAAVNHRSFCLQVQRLLGCALPGACMVGSMAELEAHLAAAGGRGGWWAGDGGALGDGDCDGGSDGDHGGRGGGDCGDWVVKAPLSAAGRARVIVRQVQEPAGLRRPEVRRSVERLFARHGPLLFEPWLARYADIGAVGLLTAAGVCWVGFHRQQVDTRGRFAGIDLRVAGDCDVAGRDPADALPGSAADLSSGDMARWRQVLDAAAGALHRAGYRGPFGIDAWQYQDAAGVRHLHPLGEINARATFGLVAHALVERLRQPLRLAEGDRLRLRLGEAPPGATPAAAVAGAAAARRDGAGEAVPATVVAAFSGAGAVQVVPLLHAAGPSGPAAWLEIARRRL